MKIEEQLAAALRGFLEGYEDYCDAGFFDLFCHGEVIERALKALKQYEESKNHE